MVGCAGLRHPIGLPSRAVKVGGASEDGAGEAMSPLGTLLNRPSSRDLQVTHRRLRATLQTGRPDRLRSVVVARVDDHSRLKCDGRAQKTSDRCRRKGPLDLHDSCSTRGREAGSCEAAALKHRRVHGGRRQDAVTPEPLEDVPYPLKAMKPVPSMMGTAAASDDSARAPVVPWRVV